MSAPATHDERLRRWRLILGGNAAKLLKLKVPRPAAPAKRAAPAKAKAKKKKAKARR